MSRPADGRGNALEQSLQRAAQGVPGGQVDDVLRLLRAGLDEIDDTVGADDLAVEIDAATAVPPAERLSAARRFADQRRAVTLGRRAWDLLGAFVSDRNDSTLMTAAQQLLSEVTDALGEITDEQVRLELGNYALECRYMLSGGAGPVSLRGGKLIR